CGGGGGGKGCWGGAADAGPSGQCECFYTPAFADGIFFRGDIIRKLPLTQITDGTSNTFLIGEDIPHLNCWSAWPYANDAISTCAIPPNINLDQRYGICDAAPVTSHFAWAHTFGCKSGHPRALQCRHARRQ